MPSRKILSSYPFSHKYQGLEQPDEIPLHDVEKQPLHAQPYDRFATVITDQPTSETDFLKNYDKNSKSNFLSVQPSDDKAIVLTDGGEDNHSFNEGGQIQTLMK